MAEEEPDELFDEFRTRLISILEKDQVSVALAYDTKQITPEVFLDRYFNRELAVLLNVSQRRVYDILVICLNCTDAILPKAPIKEWKFQPVYSLCVYYTLLRLCFSAHPVNPPQDTIDENTGGRLARQAATILSTEFGAYTYYLRNHFCQTLAVIGSRSRSIASIVFKRARGDIQTNGGKNFQSLIRPWIYLSGSVLYLPAALKELANDLSIMSKDYRKVFGEAILNMILFAFKQHHEGYTAFLCNGGLEFDPGRAIFDKIDSLDKDARAMWPAAMALLLLFRPFEDHSVGTDFLNRLRTIGDQKYIPQALVIGWRALALSYFQPKLTDFMKQFYDQFLAWYLTQKFSSQASDEFGTFMLIDFPFCVLYINPGDFVNKIIPMLTNDKNDLSSYLVRIIRRACKLSKVAADASVSTLEPLVLPCFNIFKKALNDKDPKVHLTPIISGFCAYPSFMRLVLDKQPGFTELFFRLVRDYKQIRSHAVLLGYFDAVFVSESTAAIPFRTNVNAIIEFVEGAYRRESLFQAEKGIFNEAIPAIVSRISNFLLLLFRDDSSQLQEWRESGPEPFFNLESLAIMFLASSKKDIRLTGVTVMSNLIEMLHAVDSTLDLEIPIDNLETLVTDARFVPNLTTGHSCITNTFRTIPVTNFGMDKAWDGLFEYFLSLTTALSKKVKVDRPALTFPVTLLSDEWIGVAAIVFSVLGSQPRQLFEIAIQILEDEGDLGSVAASAIPGAIHVNNLMPFVYALQTKITQMQNPRGFFDVTAASSVFFQNAMRVLRGLIELKYWTTDLIDADVFWTLTGQLVAYSD
jgi:hypothetical protein